MIFSYTFSINQEFINLLGQSGSTVEQKRFFALVYSLKFCDWIEKREATEKLKILQLKELLRFDSTREAANVLERERNVIFREAMIGEERLKREKTKTNNP